MLAEALDQAAAFERVIASSPLGVERLSALLACADRLVLLGEGARAIELLELAHIKLSDSTSAHGPGVMGVLVRALLSVQRNQDALSLVERGLDDLAGDARGGRDHTLLRVLEAQCLGRLSRLAESQLRLESLRSELLARPDGELLALTVVNMSGIFIRRGNWDAARACALEAWVSARRAGSLLLEGMAQGNVCIAERGRCRWHQAEEAGQDSVDLLTRAGALAAADHSRRSLAISQLKLGKWEESLITATAAIPKAEQRNRTSDRQYALLLKSQACLHAGQVDAAKAAIQDRQDDSTELSESRPELLRLEYLGDVELEQGHAEAALQRYDEVLPHALALIPRGDVVAELRRRRAECYLLLGRAPDAYTEAKDGLELCLELGDRYEEAATYRTLALAAAALGRPDEAKKLFDHGFAMYDDIETPYEWGKHWMAYGDWLAGDHAGAYANLGGSREAYRAAIDHFEHMGAELKLAHARERMTTLERRLHDEGAEETTGHDKPRPRRRPSLSRELQRKVQWAFDTFGVVTRHRPLIEMLEQVAVVAPSDIPVLVLGESGTGKELIARGVHVLSGRTGCLVEVNCSAVPATMMESEFFGSVHGSFTGSTRDRAGLFEEAHEGSIFMDEIGEMPLDLQSKLLRFLETGEVRRIGANGGRHVDARLIAATNREASKIQTAESFRQDLYYRLAHAVFTLPPLRSRGDDMTVLVDHFLDAFTDEQKKSVTLSRAARERLLGHAWPGNVRELRSLLQRLVVQSAPGHVVTPRDIPLAATPGTPRNFLEEMENQEKTRIVEALEKSHYIKADAARTLRMSRTTLLGKMKRYRIPG